MESPKRLRKALLPDELFIEILLRLPAEIVHRFQSVCRKWRALTSTPYFVDRHYMRQGVPSILLQEKAGCTRGAVGGGMELFLIENWEEDAIQMDLTITNLRPECIEADSWHSYHPCFSYNGLVVLEGTFHEPKERGFRSLLTDFIIYNPINQDTVRILTPKGLGGEIYGLFLHPTLKEYCILCGLFRGKKVQFKMVNLGPQDPQWKEIQAGSSVAYRPNLPPVQINDVLYWTIAVCRKNHYLVYPTCNEFIMAFNITREELLVMPHPGHIAGCGPESHRGMDLLKSDMHLSLVQISCRHNNHSSTTIDIWMLTDVAERVWVKRYSINVEESLKPAMTRVISIANKDLLLQWDCKRFCVCNLQHGSIRKFGREYVGCWSALAHYKSLVSLKNCKPEIRMEETTRRTRARTAK